ncbi:rho GTPase-activating protein 22-like [Protopterus annectens]|uniref:rho GTPase-activating protein 22-like n=1 Tax=Protopterus annectens TaxID=7888 RepID=UPI001CFA6F62|nr:rho GTPase-activating protein 22-like [Protopterus annectens]
MHCIFDCIAEIIILNPSVHWSYFSARSKSLVMGDQSGSCSRATSPALQERVLKAGWLKKQTGIMKNWQQRWFVLRGEQLHYYKDAEETKPQEAPPLTKPKESHPKRSIPVPTAQGFPPGSELSHSKVITWKLVSISKYH